MALNNRNKLAKEISRFRQAMEWTQDELARELDVTAASISRWEAGISIPKPEHLHRIADIGRAHNRPFLSQYRNIREQEQLTRTLGRAAGVLETYEIGDHTVALLEDGSLMIDGHVRVS